ncbi:hypothetical protein E2C01_045200 [Portunus trituberculatus]|uniref:Uncharacterized protein n=1 Tax=Portunus trituberculatus TaxID=210409 RepID=A0A5B7G0L7_PORTR|nr:hypothetical protein [Portunus trituberculatus]
MEVAKTFGKCGRQQLVLRRLANSCHVIGIQGERRRSKSEPRPRLPYLRSVLSERRSGPNCNPALREHQSTLGLAASVGREIRMEAEAALGGGEEENGIPLLTGQGDLVLSKGFLRNLCPAAEAAHGDARQLFPVTDSLQLSHTHGFSQQAVSHSQKNTKAGQHKGRLSPRCVIPPPLTRKNATKLQASLFVVRRHIPLLRLTS